METLDPVYFYYANGKVAGVTLVGRRQLQEPAESQDPEFVSHWDGLSEEEKSDVMAVEDLRASLQRKAGAAGADNNSEQQPLGDEAEVPPSLCRIDSSVGCPSLALSIVLTLSGGWLQALAEKLRSTLKAKAAGAAAAASSR